MLIYGPSSSHVLYQQKVKEINAGNDRSPFLTVGSNPNGMLPQGQFGFTPIDPSMTQHLSFDNPDSNKLIK
jgi:hypothetical protein